eukprot:TRINITY_DN16540_c0_g1_i5.p1 TRINITY_DN16540_c0_g1~~TRINITY_DN16540_c0_g1_i5.p1  ORF type:complete len:552 (-),score=101.86 TRINITY_DN16540_c0_g1_i5:40-1695(-)
MEVLAKTDLNLPDLFKLTSKSDEDDYSTWPSDSCLSVSRDATLVVLGNNTRVVVVAQKQSREQAAAAWSTTIFDEIALPSLVSPQGASVPNDVVTQVCFITLASFHLPICIGVGYLSGHLRIFTPSGVLLLSQLLHKGKVARLVPRQTPVTCSGASSSSSQQVTEELTILYASGVVANITGSSLFQVLQVAYAQSLHKDDALPASSSATTLAFRKWGLAGIDTISDIASCGPLLPSPFELFNFSTPSSSPSLSAFPSYTNSSATPPSSTYIHHSNTSTAHRLLGVGRNPPVSFFVAEEGQDSTYSIAINLASTVATKLTSAVLGFAKSWWGAKPKDQDEPPVKETPIEPAHPLPTRWSLSDPHRQAQSVTLSPTGHLAATTDGYGRVLLVDVIEGFVVRMWKGYRDAQCGWVQYDPTRTIARTSEPKQTTSSSSSGWDNDNWDEDEGGDEDDKGKEKEREESKKSASGEPLGGLAPLSLHLVIYGSRRGIVEVWRMKHGERVGIMHVGSGCKLISTTVQHEVPKAGAPSSQCFLVSPGGSIREIVLYAKAM